MENDQLGVNYIMKMTLCSRENYILRRILVMITFTLLGELYTELHMKDLLSFQSPLRAGPVTLVRRGPGYNLTSNIQLNGTENYF